MNSAGGIFGTVSGGNSNLATGSYSSVLGGKWNTATVNYTAILGICKKIKPKETTLRL